MNVPGALTTGIGKLRRRRTMAIEQIDKLGVWYRRVMLSSVKMQ